MTTHQKLKAMLSKRKYDKAMRQFAECFFRPSSVWKYIAMNGKNLRLLKRSRSL